MDLLLEFLTFCVYFFAQVFFAVIWVAFVWCLFIGLIQPVGGKILYALKESLRGSERDQTREPACIVVEDSPADELAREDVAGDSVTIEVAPLPSSGDKR